MIQMRNRGLYRVLAFILCIFVLNSCSNSNKIKIGYLIPNTEGDRYKKEQVYFHDKIASLGGEALSLSAEYDDKLQIKQADDLMAQGVKVLVINCVNQVTAAAIVRNAHEKNVKVIAYDRLISNCDLDYYLSFDNVEVGKQMAEYTVKLKPEGKYVLLGGDKADMNALLVKNGQLAVLEPYITSGKIKIVLNIFVEDWSGDNAAHEMKKFLELSGVVPDVILSSNDGMATGVVEVLKSFNLDGKVIITGQDAELEACRNIVKDKQTMTMYKPIMKLANTAAEISMKLARGEKISEAVASIYNGQKKVDAILLSPVVVDKNNLKTTVLADGLLKESDLNN